MSSEFFLTFVKRDLVYSNPQRRVSRGSTNQKIMKSMFSGRQSVKFWLTGAPRSRIIPTPIWKNISHLFSIRIARKWRTHAWIFLPMFMPMMVENPRAAAARVHGRDSVFLWGVPSCSKISKIQKFHFPKIPRFHAHPTLIFQTALGFHHPSQIIQNKMFDLVGFLMF